MKICTLEYIRLSDLFEGLPGAEEWFRECDWHDFTWGDTSHAMLPACDLYIACDNENDDDPHEDEKIAVQITSFLTRVWEAGNMMVDLAT